MAAADNVTPLEAEAADEGYSFEFADETWDLIEDFNILDFQEQLEAQRVVAAFRYALGDQYDDFKNVAGGDVDSFKKATEALVDAVGLGDPGNSRASRRSSARQRSKRR
jgi:hypothetical protein